MITHTIHDFAKIQNFRYVTRDGDRVYVNDRRQHDPKFRRRGRDAVDRARLCPTCMIQMPLTTNSCEFC